MSEPSPSTQSMPPTLRAQRRTVREAAMSFLIHHNPFYLLSALSMIVGCYALNAGLELRSGQVGRILVLLATINVYEIMLLALGVYLIERRNELRDGRTLLLLQIVFLLDLSFLNSELMTGPLWVGAPISAVMLIVSLGKVWFVLRGLSVRFPARLYGAIAIQLVALFTVPCVLKWISHDGYVTPRQFYVTWWIIGAIPMLIELQRRFFANPDDDAHPSPWIGRVYAVVAYVSIIAHLGMLHWVYKANFYIADLSPILLGLTFTMSSLRPTTALPAAELRLAKWALPAAACIFALNTSPALDFDFASPLQLTLAGAYVAIVYSFFLAHALILLTVCALVALGTVFGPSVAQLERVLDAIWRFVLRLVPHTPIQWGVTGIIGAFTFLGIGAAVSFSKKDRPINGGESS